MTQSGTGQWSAVKLDPPRFVSGKAMPIAGLKVRFTPEAMNNIAQLWLRFVPHIGHSSGQVGRVAYGLFANMTSNPFGFDYMAGVEVSSTSRLPPGFSHVTMPAQRYVVFSHHGPVSNIRDTIDAAHKWFVTSGLSATQAGHDLPVMLERYGEGFDPRTATGDIEIWTPMKE